jgi:hypothetical protein
LVQGWLVGLVGGLVCLVRLFGWLVGRLFGRRLFGRRLFGRLFVCLVGWLVRVCLVGSLVVCLVGWLFVCLFGRFVGCLFVWSVGRLVGWLVVYRLVVCLVVCLFVWYSYLFPISPFFCLLFREIKEIKVL